jgi:hypothetical protein
MLKGTLLRWSVCIFMFAPACGASGSGDPSLSGSGTPGAGSNPTTEWNPTSTANGAAACDSEISLPAPRGSVLSVSTSDDLQGVIDAAQPGDEIVLPGGAVFTGNFHLPAKSGDAFITLRSDSAPALPEGARMTPEAAQPLPKLVGKPGHATLQVDSGAHHYRLVGLEIAAPASDADTVIAVGTASETSTSNLPHDLIFDRLYVHGDPTQGAKRGIALNGAQIAITNSSVTEIKKVGIEAQAIAGWNGSGPFHIVNNLLEGAGENILFGGQDAKIPNLVPSDIVIRYNIIRKPLTWKSSEKEYAGLPVRVKNLLELKNAQRVTIDGNLFENSWEESQDGKAAVFTPRNQDGGAPWAVVQSVKFMNNVVRHVGGGIGISGQDDIHSSQLAHDFLIQNNVFYDVGGPRWGGKGGFLLLVGGATNAGPANVQAIHNTALQSGDALISTTKSPSATHPGFVFSDNLLANGPFGIHADWAAAGDPTLAARFPDGQFSHNALIGANSDLYKAHPDNFFPATPEEVRFKNAPDGNLELSSGSPLQGKASDRGDVGANFANFATAAACRK